MQTINGTGSQERPTIGILKLLAYSVFITSSIIDFLYSFHPDLDAWKIRQEMHVMRGF